MLLDPHNEYGKAFGDVAEIVNVDNLQLPLWLLDFEEAVGVLVRGGTMQEQEAQALASLTGWNLASIRTRMALNSQPPTRWWER